MNTLPSPPSPSPSLTSLPVHPKLAGSHEPCDDQERAQVFQEIAARSVPVEHKGLPERLRQLSQFILTQPIEALLTLGLALLALQLLSLALNWGVLHAVFQIDEGACQSARGEGACWGMVGEKFRMILWGRYPYAEQWRCALSCALALGMLGWSVGSKAWTSKLRTITLWAWVITGLVIQALMSGNFLGLRVLPLWPSVETELWGGLPLTLILSLGSIALATPMGILLALGRTSEMPIIQSICVLYIELVRGVPLISVLFMASFMFPLLMPTLQTPDVLIRVLLGITLFSAAYTAEVVRGGLQAVDKGQLEAAQSLNLGYWQTQRHVILPQALAHIIPGMVNNFIAIFKDTSLVTIVSLYELTGALGLALNGDANWRPYKLEGYLFIAAIYFFFCFALSRVSQNLEHRLANR